MKSRLALGAMLVLGLLMSASGTTLALSGSSDSGSAAGSQYPDTSPSGQVLGQEESSGEEPNSTTQGSTTQGNQSAPQQETRQVTAAQGGNNLPFTGLAAIPIILAGVALMGGGAALHRKSRTP